ncbi:MAG: hypothetical protein KGI52_06615, partial [Burkholderiales bacterium]|nr:hypothetical protein [Burkholderiales bacterium]
IWPPWYAPTSDDRTADANTLRTLVDAGLMSQETATRRIAPVYDIEDPAAERAVIDTEMAARNADAQKRVQITE